MEKSSASGSAPLATRVDDISALLTEQKAMDVVCLDISQKSGGGFADRLFILTATSPRHARSIAEAISALCREKKYEFLRIEGQEVGEWVLVDLNDIVVCIFLEATRALYRLEDMWSHFSRDTGHE